MVIPLFLIFILYTIRILETGMNWDFTHLGIYPLSRKGIFGIFAHPLVHNNFQHLLANTFPLFFLSWCLFYFYKDIAPYIFFSIWIGCGLLTFIIGKPGWHIGASGLIYGLAFFLFLSGIIRKYIPLIAISLLVAFLYGSLIWNMFPFFANETTSWEGHLSGATAGLFCAVLFKNYGPQKPETFTEEDTETAEGDEEDDDIISATTETEKKEKNAE